MKPITRRFVSNLFTRQNGDAVLYSTRSWLVDLGGWVLVRLRRRGGGWDDADIIVGLGRVSR